MQALLRELISLSVLTGALMYLCPDGGGKRVASVLCTAVLSLAVLTHLGGMHREDFLPESTGIEDTERWIEESGAAAGMELSRRYLQEEYAQYISSRASAFGMQMPEVKMTLMQDANGQWLPYAAELSAVGTARQREALTGALQEELGIPPERQVWHEPGVEH